MIKKDKDNRGHAYVKRILTERGPLPLPEIMGAADTCSPSTARDAVYSLAREGVIYRTNPNETGRGVFAIYAMREDISKK